MRMSRTDGSSLFAEAFTKIWKSKDSRVGVVLLALIVLSYTATSIIAPYGVNEMDLAGMFGAPSLKHIFGTDAVGRDLFSRLLHGGRYSLALRICIAVFSAVLGCLIGCIAGYFGGRTEALVMRFLDIWSSLPGMLLCVLISAVLGAGFFHTVLTLAIGDMPIDIRLIQGQILSERSKDYLEVAQSINCSHLSIIFRHILPGVISPVVVDATMNIGIDITITMALSCIGLEIQPPMPEWGAMLADARAHMLNYPHLVIFPGTIITLIVLAINLIGDGLRDVMDPKLHS